MKRGLRGAYQQPSDKHFHRYVNRFTFRHNKGNGFRHTLDRLDSFIDGVVSRRLTHKALIH